MARRRSLASAVAVPDMNELFDLSPVPTAVLSPSYQIQRATPGLLTAWRLPQDAFIGRGLLVVFRELELFARVEDEAFLTDALERAVATRTVQTSSAIYTAKGSSWEARVTPYFRDSELLSLGLAWEQLTREDSGQQMTDLGLYTDEALRILIQAVKDYAIFLLDTEGLIVTWNSGAELNKQYKKEEIVGKHFSIFYGDEDLKAKKPEKELEICKRDGRVEDEGWRYRKDGSRFWANVVITAVYKNGVHVGFGKVTRNLTERKAAEWRLIAAYEESAKLKSDFLANMSHEIRTPMHGMLSACSLLLDTRLTPEQRDTANIIGESGQVLLQVINDILDYSKLASGNFSINSDVVGVANVLTSVVRSEQTTLASTIQCDLRLDSNLPQSVQGDPLRYRQVLQNIIGNAAKFTDQGSICITASVLSQDEDNIIILTEVTDTGIGISEPAATSLFTPFTQLEDTKRKRYQGTGLGLSISKSLAELMGGEIGYRPNPTRQGSVFWFTAKFKKIKSLEQIHTLKEQMEHRVNEAGGAYMPESAPKEPVQLLKVVAPSKRLLVVEDNPINQKVLLKTLHSLGFTGIALAGDGQQAVDLVCADPHAYDLVLMDINMPVLDGHEATVQIRQRGIKIPIVAMTAHALKGHIELCLEKGMDDYISKPMDRRKVISTLLKWLADDDGKSEASKGTI